MFILKIRSKNTTLWYRPCSPIYIYFCNNLFAINNCGAVNNVIAVEYNNVFTCHAVQILLFYQCLSDMAVRTDLYMSQYSAFKGIL